MREQMIEKILEILSTQSLWVIEQVYRFAVNMKGGVANE